MVSVEVHAKVESNWSCAFELEVMLVLQEIHKFLGIYHGNAQVIHVDGDILISVTVCSHPDVWLSLTGLKAKFSHTVCKLVMPSCSATS